MKKTWVEITCDECGCADHYLLGNVDEIARTNGWKITRDGKHFCEEDCYQKHRKPVDNNDDKE